MVVGARLAGHQHMRRTSPKHGSRRDGAVQAWVRALSAMKAIEGRPDITLMSLVREAANGRPDAIALIDRYGQFTYRELEDRSAYYMDWAIAQGVAPGDRVGLLMLNRLDYVAIWFGISQAGGVVALLNTNLFGAGLAHCIRAAAPTHLIVAAEMMDRVRATMPQLADAPQCWVHGLSGEVGIRRIDLNHSAAVCRAVSRRRPTASDPALLIYTSGTTGLPKAAIVTHGRLVEWSCWFAAAMDVTSADRLYDCLPMYHSTGGVVAIGAMLVKGGSVMIARRFSVNRFWDDVVDGNCTIVLYIGELCRYLAHSRTHPRELQHRLRLACGNGLRADIWQQFRQRFAIPHLAEFYAATEGNVSFYNWEEKPGAVGRVPQFLAHRFPVALIRCNVESGEPRRGADGFCIRCAPDEIGEAIGQIAGPDASSTRPFDGYTDIEATARKVLHDVFVPGDRWFRTGDLMRKDRAGYYYFVDRIGDTFRWKGENVSTTEVSAVLAACPGVTEAVVYGVVVPGNEGRAGMAAVTVEASFDLAVLHRHLAASLPDYARPRFLRVCERLEVTGTFKPIKARLMREGYSSSVAPDPVWFYDRSRGAFIVCDDQLRAAID